MALVFKANRLDETETEWGGDGTEHVEPVKQIGQQGGGKPGEPAKSVWQGGGRKKRTELTFTVKERDASG